MVPIVVRPDTFEGRAADIFGALFDLRSVGWVSFDPPERRLNASEVLRELHSVATEHLGGTGVNYREHVKALTAASKRSGVSTRNDVRGLLLIANGLCDYAPSDAVLENVLTFVDALLSEIIYLNYFLERQMEKQADRNRTSSIYGKKSGQISHEKAERWRTLLESALRQPGVVAVRTQGERCRYLKNYLANMNLIVSEQTLSKYLANRHKAAVSRRASIKR